MTLLPSARRSWVRLLRAWPAIVAALVVRALAYATMTALALWNETRPAPTLPDLVLGVVPYVPWVDRANYLAWLVLYLPLTLVFLWTEPRRWARYMVTGGIVSVVRGVCIALTGLGVPDPLHAGRGIAGRSIREVYLDLLSPLGVFSRGTLHAYLTKDLFFSGHTATTFLLLLYVWHRPRLRWFALAAHLLVVSTVVMAHLHYSIDIVGAWAITYSIFAFREVRRDRSHSPAARVRIDDGAPTE